MTTESTVIEAHSPSATPRGLPLKEAREAHLEARRMVSEGKNPTEAKQINRLKAEMDDKRFSHYAKEWVAKQNQAQS